ncbi:AAA family ATPase [Myroides marinus]|nr:AAA family ATPase [Myroides marinus]
MNTPLNQILYGPPGTGKTYHTINKALAIVAPDFDLDQEREVVKQEFDKYVENGQIVFTTFHQSMTYEDFVEGIKPEIEDSIESGQRTVVYDINDGIFKSIVKDAKLIQQVNDINVDWDNINYYKMSLGGKQNPLEHDYCIMNNVGGISWGGEHDLSELTSLVKWEEYRDRFKELYPDLVSESSYNVLASFTLNKMKEGDIVIATKGNHIVDAIGIVNGGYTYDNNNETSLRHFRSIEWIIRDLNASPEKFFDKKISQQSIYEFYNANVKKDVFKNLLNVKNGNSPLSYVLIIDEINRGNVSAIFGELITLIEESKRLGKEEALQVTLPYSKEKFGVPDNLYIIGTMNTADRSVEALDTALRRRFTFEEMMPDYEVIESENSLGIDLKEVLETINARMEVLLDRDHLIGHSYFLGVDSIATLMSRFKNNIIPLLQEYFYGDYGKIGLVLGGGFVTKVEGMKVSFASFDYDSEMYQDKITYTLKPIEDEGEFRKAIDALLIKK